LNEIGRDRELDAKHQLLALLRCLDRFRRKLRLGRDEGNFCRDDILRDGIEDYSSIIAQNEPTGFACRQEDCHVDVGQIDEC
jgi:hypothetical protein